MSIESLEDVFVRCFKEILNPTCRNTTAKEAEKTIYILEKSNIILSQLVVCERFESYAANISFYGV